MQDAAPAQPKSLVDVLLEDPLAFTERFHAILPVSFAAVVLIGIGVLTAWWLLGYRDKARVEMIEYLKILLDRMRDRDK